MLKVEADKYAEGEEAKVDRLLSVLAVSLLAIAGHVAFQAVETAVCPSVLFPLRSNQQ